MTIEKATLEKLYIDDRLSMMQISKQLACSPHKVEYWMTRFNIKRRTISDAIYDLNNPDGDPFNMKEITTQEDAILLGIGIGLYWGEGNKRNKHSVRLGNTDPGIIKTFRKFLVEICGINPDKLRYGLQVFSDINPKNALEYWMLELDEPIEKFGEVVVTPARSIGTYRDKNQTGVLTVYFHNYKLRDIIVKLCRDNSFDYEWSAMQ